MFSNQILPSLRPQKPLSWQKLSHGEKGQIMWVEDIGVLIFGN
jgi:hypothetical protein